MALQTQLMENPLVEYENGLFYQKGFQRHPAFEEVYLNLRKKENRMHSDDVVRKLPQFISGHPNALEWQMRSSTLHKIIKYLKASGARRVLELGCGNGWLSYNLSTSLDIEIYAVDINEPELLQGSRVFKGQENLSFICGDIFSPLFTLTKFQVIILGGTAQYFSDLQKLLSTLADLLDPSGCIYIADSPFYSSRAESELARRRSLEYFTTLGFPDMVDRYFHHTFDELRDWNYKMLYNPRSPLSIIKRKILNASLSIFPILCIKKEDAIRG